MDPSRYRRGGSPIEWIVEVIVSRSLRVSVLLGTAYLSGFAGLGVSFFGDAGGPTDPHTTLGVGLMALSFVCLFVASVTILDITAPKPGRDR